jgi:hypothetical protein
MDCEFSSRKLFPSHVHLLFSTSLSLSRNANSDKKRMPLLVCRSENPQALKNVAKSSLPLIWKSHRKVWTVSQVFHDWFAKFLLMEVKNYCVEKNRDFRILLILGKVCA